MDKAEQTELTDSDVGANADAGTSGGNAGENPGGEGPGENAGEDFNEDLVEGSEGPLGTGYEEESEGGASARPEVPYWLSQVPYFLVMSALAAGIVVVAAAYFKRGPALIAGALLLAAAFRMFLPKEWTGMLAVRRRWVDLLTLISLAVLLIVLAWVAPQLSS